MTPFYFGTGQRRLLGILTPKQTSGASQRGLVLCNPWGVEYERAHRAMRQLAKQLARVGYDVLRFDYYGTGDSSGDMTAADVAGWRADIGAAIEELRDSTGAERVGLVGLRLGATLAAGVASDNPDAVDSLVMWDPVVSGKDYLAELLGRRRPEQDGANESATLLHLDGFPLSDALRNDFHALDLISLAASLPRRTFVIVSDPSPSHSLLETVLTTETIEAERPWVEERSLGVGAIPANVLRRVVEWCA